MSYQGSGGAQPLERAIDDYLRAPDTRKTRRHLAYDEADLRVIAQRLPGMDDGWPEVATVDDISDANLRAAFSKYLVDATEQEALRAARTWRGFLGYLSNRRLVNPTAVNGVPPPPPRRSTLRSVVIAPSKGLIATIVLPIILVLAQQYISTVQQQTATDKATRSDQIRANKVDAIQATVKAFDNLSAQAIKVVNYDLENPDLAKDMVAVRVDMGRQQSSVVALTVTLLTQFPDLGSVAANNIGISLGTFLATIDSAAYYIGRSDTADNQKTELQSAMNLVNAGYLVLGAPVVALLNCLLDYGDKGLKQVCGYPRSDSFAQLVRLANTLQARLDELTLQEAAYPLLFAIPSPQAQSYNVLDRELSLWLAEDPARQVTDFPKYPEMVRLYKSIDRGSRLRANDVSYSREYLLGIAEYFDLKFRLEFHSPAPDCNSAFEEITACFQRPSAPPPAGG